MAVTDPAVQSAIPADSTESAPLDGLAPLSKPRRPHGRRRLHDASGRMFEDHRSSDAIVYRKVIRALNAELNLATPLLRMEGERVALLASSSARGSEAFEVAGRDGGLPLAREPPP